MFDCGEKFLEILAPAKNLFYAKEAIKCGADAVYVGASKYGMRNVANNSLEDIQKIVEYAHKYWVKVYVTLNCILYTEDDMAESIDILNKLYHIGVDGIIIQDMGILEHKLPPVPIILSTTVKCLTKEDVQFFEKCGVDRIVLPRELTFEEIKDITENSNMKIEVFCFGFLCPCYSGSCYITYVENFRKTRNPSVACYQAANSGVCYARCSGNWTLRDCNDTIIRENDRLLNLRYLNLQDRVGDLFDVGVDSFKIEGRAQDLKYVKNATAIFSNVANEVVQKRNARRYSSGRTILGFVPDKNNVFNKGYTDFFLSGRKKEMYSKSSLIGENVGCVQDFDGESFILNSDIKLNPSDRLRYQKGDNYVQTIEILDVKQDRYFIAPINDDINALYLYRYYNSKVFEQIENSVNYRVISVSVKIHEENGSYVIKAEDEDKNSVVFSYEKGLTLIKSSEIQKQLYELKEDCEFIIDNAFSDKDIFIDDINALKEEIYSELRAEREKNRPIYRKQAKINDVKFYKKELDYLYNINNKYSESFWTRHGVEKFESGFETLSDISDKKAVSARYCLKYELGYCYKNGSEENMPPMPWTIEQCQSGNKYKIEFDCDDCKMYLYNID